MKPFKGEVVDAVVDKVGKVSFYSARFSCSRLTCSPQLGFFAYLGPMQIFVSTFVSLASAFPISLHLPCPEFLRDS